jgi:hypothetical protein
MNRLSAALLPGMVANAPHPDQDAIRRKLTDILSRPEFRPAPDLSWLLGPFADLLRWLEALSAAAPFLFWMLLAGCLGLLGLIVFLLARTVWRMMTVERRAATEDQGRAQRARLSQAYRQEARDRADRGDFTEAVRYLFLSLVYRLDEEGRVLFQRARTNREYLGLFDDRPEVRSDLRVFVDTLDSHWYAQRPTDGRQYAECLALYESLQRRA